MFQRGHCHLLPLVTSLLSGPQDAFSKAPSPHHAGNSGLLPARDGSGNDSLCSLCFRHRAHHAPAWWKSKYQKSNKNSSPIVQGCTVSVPSHDLAKARTEVSQLLWGLGPKAGFSSHAEVTVVLRAQTSQSGGLRRME